jgi:methionine salvage enolase-phosphatase E1
VSIGYTSYFEQFLKTGDLDALFSGYFKTYIGQIPAQAFDKINENFIRTTFFELCTRYLSDYFTFAIILR